MVLDGTEWDTSNVSQTISDIPMYWPHSQALPLTHAYAFDSIRIKKPCTRGSACVRLPMHLEIVLIHSFGSIECSNGINVHDCADDSNNYQPTKRQG